jgi:hypothetical protein
VTRFEQDYKEDQNKPPRKKKIMARVILWTTKWSLLGWVLTLATVILWEGELLGGSENENGESLLRTVGDDDHGAMLYEAAGTDANLPPDRPADVQLAAKAASMQSAREPSGATAPPRSGGTGTAGDADHPDAGALRPPPRDPDDPLSWTREPALRAVGANHATPTPPPFPFRISASALVNPYRNAREIAKRPFLGTEPLVNRSRLAAAGNLFGTCAVVATAGNILNSTYGAEIDEHDYVIRIKGGPTDGFERDVGTKMDLVVSNVGVFSPLILRGIARTGGKLLVTMPRNAAYRPPSELLPLQSLYTVSRAFENSVSSVLRAFKLPPSTASTGLKAVIVALHLCQRVDMYGFGNFDSENSRRTLAKKLNATEVEQLESHPMPPTHYFELDGGVAGYIPDGPGAHSYATEGDIYRSYIKQGLLRVHLGNEHHPERIKFYPVGVDPWGGFCWRIPRRKTLEMYEGCLELCAHQAGRVNIRALGRSFCKSDRYRGTPVAELVAAYKREHPTPRPWLVFTATEGPIRTLREFGYNFDTYAGYKKATTHSRS